MKQQDRIGSAVDILSRLGEEKPQLKDKLAELINHLKKIDAVDFNNALRALRSNIDPRDYFLIASCGSCALIKDEEISKVWLG
ncbi:MAG: hypothetical protein ACFFCW_39310 [Candidatus Hodarchaeota archaeon]